MIFSYEAYRKGGEKVFGTVDADNKEMAGYQLFQQDLIVIRLRELKKDKNVRVKEVELIFFTRLLATAVNASIPLTRALEITSGELSAESSLRFIISSILHEIKTGKNLSDAMALYRGVFSELYVNMVRAGERSGKLGASLLDVLRYIQKRFEMKRKISGALMYPGMILSFAFLVLGFFAFGLIPKFRDSYAQFGSELPAPTLILMNAADWLRANILVIAGVLVVLILLIRFLARTERGRDVTENLLFSVPVAGELYRKDIIARMARTLSVLVQNGITLVEALELARGIVASRAFERIINDGIQSLTQGGKLSAAFKGKPQIPTIFVQMTAMGEESGKVGELMENLSEFYEKDVDDNIEKLTTLMTPVMIIFIGIIIGVVVLVLFLPIFNLSSVMK
jgi:type IV pilus assembly protein PilC